MKTADAYIRSIRSKAKKAYAKAYLAWRRDSHGTESNGPSRPAELTVMGAQAVRIELNQILGASVAPLPLNLAP